MPLTQIPTGMFEDNSVTSAKLSADLRNQTPAFKNRIINGDMRIDQRNAGASVTPTTSAQAFAVDRTSTIVSQNSKLTVQQNAGSVTPPAGFTNYLGATSSSAYSVLTSDYFNFNQTIEGFNIADLGWGTANAQTVTLSFWIRSSLTGTHSGSLRNGAANRSYVFSFSVSSANTWEQKTITIAGDTSGTWQTGNGAGMFVSFNLGAGSTFATTAGAWVAGNFIGATGSVNVVGTNGATFYVTGVQLEEGVVSTNFDVRPYGTELSLCQRYFETSYEAGNAVGSTANPSRSIAWLAQATANYNNQRVNFSVYKRSDPTIVLLNPATGTVSQVRNLDANTNLAGTVSFTSVTGFLGYVNNVSVTVGVSLGYHYTASSEL